MGKTLELSNLQILFPSLGLQLLSGKMQLASLQLIVRWRVNRPAKALEETLRAVLNKIFK